MEISNSQLMSALRTMAWERAKGELRSMLHTFYSGSDCGEQFNLLRAEIDKFIGHIEDHALQE